jgi:diguanylate cyclase (GGDEF)-like protein
MKFPVKFNVGDRVGPKHPYSDVLKDGFGGLRFSPMLEREFREFYEARNLPRARFSLVTAITVVLMIGIVDYAAGSVDAGPLVNMLRIGVLLPLLASSVLAAYLPGLRRHHSTIATVGVAVIGIVVIYMCQTAALAGESFLLMGPLLIVLYASLFLGLLFRNAVALSSGLVLAYALIGASIGMQTYMLVYSTTLLAVAAVVGSYSAYSFERLLRQNFVEARFLNELAERDGLTGLYNRRIFDDLIKRIWRQARREDAAIEIIFIDIDYFKIYNDLYGHQAGDDCLKTVARTIDRAAKRPFDFAARYGGEEFVLVLYGPPGDYARSLPERIRLDVAGLAIPHEGAGVGNTVTVSVGVAQARPSEGRSLTGAIQVADEALYEAKRAGRNRVVYKDANDSEVETGKFRAGYRQIVT